MWIDGSTALYCVTACRRACAPALLARAFACRRRLLRRLPAPTRVRRQLPTTTLRDHRLHCVPAQLANIARLEHGLRRAFARKREHCEADVLRRQHEVRQ